MMPRLAAEESLRRVMEVAVGSGIMKKEDQRRVLREWSKAAGTEQRVQKPRSREEHRQMLASMGIGTRCQRN